MLDSHMAGKTFVTDGLREATCNGTENEMFIGI
jgi:hypothetical protein